MILNLGFQRLLLEGNSFSVIETICCNDPNFSRKGNLISEIRSPLSRFMECEILFRLWSVRFFMWVDRTMKLFTCLQDMLKLWIKLFNFNGGMTAPDFIHFRVLIDAEM